MGSLKNILQEIRKQLTETPRFATKIFSKVGPEFLELRAHINEQIEKAIKQNSKPLIFLIGPFGGGKTTQVQYFLQKHPQLHSVYKSFVKITTLDFAFLHLTSYWGRLIFISVGILISSLIIWFIPLTGCLPFLLAIGYLFTKNTSNLIYTFHETLDNLFSQKDKLIVIEDLERSSLSANEQWALLANLWEYKRKYLITLGYSPDQKKEKLKLLEYAIKLDGVIIEIPSSAQINETFMQMLDPHFPFELTEQMEETGVEWIAVFSPRELQMVREQVVLRCDTARKNLGSIVDKQLIYIEICLDLLSKKIGLEKETSPVHPIKP